MIGDIVTIDDYAHHPTEVKVTIKGARQKYPGKEIVAILKTHTLSAYFNPPYTAAIGHRNGKETNPLNSAGQK